MPSLSEFFSDPSSSGTWTLDPEQSTITVRSKGMWGLATVKVRFTKFSGEGQIAPPQTVSGQIDIDAASVQTGIRKRDNHLRSADFFEVQTYPDIKVVVTGADVVADDTVNLHADLTIKGTTKSLTLPTTVTPVGDGGMRLTGQATINRQDFAVRGNLLGSMADDVTISGDVVFRPTH
jgi:polyisoprenoid-binding protein YceI